MSTAMEGTREYPSCPADRLTIDPALTRLRAKQPVLRVRLDYDGHAWLVTRYADVKTVLADPRFSRATAAISDNEPRSLALRSVPENILSKDPPEHSRLRRLVAKAFTARRIEMLRPRTQQIVDDLLDTMLAAGSPADLAESLTWPLPITVICDLLGVPFADRDKFHTWTNHIFLTNGEVEHTANAVAHLEDYLADLVAHHRTEPADDLLGELVNARDNDDRLSEEELVNLGSALLFAGYETTANETGNFVYTLLVNRSYWGELVARPDLVPDAVEELLRITPLGAGADFTRIATEDVELGGQPIKAGDAVVTVVASANRDESVFEHADQVDFHRADNPHVAFGHGPHHCLGAQLARLEMQIALATLLRRLPSLRLAVPAEEVPWRIGQYIRGVTALPVAWDAR